HDDAVAGAAAAVHRQRLDRAAEADGHAVDDDAVRRQHDGVGRGTALHGQAVTAGGAAVGDGDRPLQLGGDDDVGVGAVAAVHGDAGAGGGVNGDDVVAGAAQDGGVLAGVVDGVVARARVERHVLQAAEVDRLKVRPGAARRPPLDEAGLLFEGVVRGG